MQFFISKGKINAKTFMVHLSDPGANFANWTHLAKLKFIQIKATYCQLLHILFLSH